MSTVVGIDPGITGAVGYISDRGYGAFDIPVMTASEKGKIKWMVDAAELGAMFVDHIPGRFNEMTVALEQTSAMPGQGVASMFSMGDSFGACRGVAAILGFSVTLVRPAQWKKEMGVAKQRGEDADAGKEKALELARELFPAAPLSRRKDHNRAEALLLAHWLKTREE
jgi:hypothetical protein